MKSQQFLIILLYFKFIEYDSSNDLIKTKLYPFLINSEYFLFEKLNLTFFSFIFYFMNIRSLPPKDQKFLSLSFYTSTLLSLHEKKE